jgi:hypothetical protein
LIAFFVVVDANENSIMEDDVTTPSNPHIASIEGKKLEKTPLDVNVSNNRTKKNHLK